MGEVGWKGSTVISFECMYIQQEDLPETKGRAITILANIMIDQLVGLVVVLVTGDDLSASDFTLFIDLFVQSE